jgi:monovalent cation:H+ antiporter, CPA1 family
VIESQVTAFVLLLMVAASIGVLVQRVPIPYVSALAVVGLIAGRTGIAQPFHLTPTLILFVLVPGLLFEAAFNVKWRHLRDNVAAVTALATVGVLLTTVLVGLLGHLALGLSLPVAMLFGAVVSPTDPVAVVAVFRKLGIPSRLANLVESESLFNDGTGAAVFAIAVAATTTGQLNPGSAALDFIHITGGGCLVGLAIGFLISLLTLRIDDAQIEITLTALAAYGGYLLAESFLHVSGILAVVCAGLVMGNFGRPLAMSARTQAAVNTFWDYVAFFLNSVIFVLIGLDVPWRDLVSHWPLVLAGAGIVLLSRAVTVYPLLALLRPLGRVVNLPWQHLIVWSGLRGAIALALLLSLQTERPAEFSAIRGLVYGVVLLTIVVQGATIGPLTRILLPHPTHRQPEPA